MIRVLLCAALLLPDAATAAAWIEGGRAGERTAPAGLAPLPAPAAPAPMGPRAGPALGEMPTLSATAAADTDATDRAIGKGLELSIAPATMNGIAPQTADPRRSDFEASAWGEAERLGFERTAPAIEEGAGAALRHGLEKGAERAAPPPPPEPPRPASILSRGVLGFFSSFALVQITVESLGLAVPQMTDPLKQGFFALGAVSAVSYLAYSLGSFVGGGLVERFGIKKVYRAVLASRAAIWAAAASLFDPTLQTIPLAALTALFSLDYFAHSIGRVAEHTLQVAWFKDSPVASSRFGTVRDFFEYGTVFAMLGTGVLISAYGFGAVVYATPALFGLAALISFALRSLPGPAAAAAKAQTSLSAGFRTLLGSAPLRAVFVGQMLLNNFFYLLYYVAATAFGVFAAHGDPRQAALVASALTGAYGIGALGGTFVMTLISGRIEARAKALPESERRAAEGAMLARSASTALGWAAAALLGAWLFASQAVLLDYIWPVFWITLALIPIGLTAQVALNHLDTVLKDRLPRESAASVLGASRTLTNLSYAASFLIWGGVFQLLGVYGFVALAAYATLAAAAYLWLARRLRR